MELLGKVEEGIRQGRLLKPGMRVAVACSGGADSVALACLLAELKETLGLRLLLVHLNHQLRGTDADADEAFVRQLAERLEVEFLVRREDVAARAQKEKVNVEEAGRQARLEFFASLIAAGKADWVALAHTLDDQAETVLGRLVRGAGTKGLAGIYPVVEPLPERVSLGFARDKLHIFSEQKAGMRLSLVRPLLGVRRGELREYLAEREQAWREDATNLDRRRLRNRIRLELLPQLSRSAGPAAIEHLGRLAEHAREEESFWAAYVEERFRALVQAAPGKDLKFEISDLMKPDPLLRKLPARRAAEAERAVARRLVRRVLAEARGDLRRLTQTHVESVLRLAGQGQSGQRVVLPGVEVERQFDRLVFRPAATRPAAPPGFELRVEAPGGVELPGGGALTFKLVALGGGEPGYNQRRQFVDAARAPFPLRVRNWQPGDAYQPLGTARVQKLKTLFREQRVPREERARTPVVLSQGEIVWVPRLGVAAAYGLTAASRTALLIEERAE